MQRISWTRSSEFRTGSNTIPDEENIMADAALKLKIHDVLKQSEHFNGPDDLVNVSDGPDDSIHVVVVSRKFDGYRMSEKNDLIWSVLDTLPPDDWGKVTLLIGTSPEEIKAI